MLILFDIDATLVTTSRAGIAAMGDAGREIYGPDFDEHTVEYAGRLDPLIIADLIRAHRRDQTREAVERFRAGYGLHLARRVAVPGVARALPGVIELIHALRRRAGDASIGLLTGNYPETGAIKLRAAGIDPDWFDVQAWGCDSPHTPPSRDHLPPVAMDQLFRRTGRRLAADMVTIIGDTPHDVRCALANGCRALGVATGSFTADRLAEAGAHLAEPDLSDTDRLEAWLLDRAASDF